MKNNFFLNKFLFFQTDNNHPIYEILKFRQNLIPTQLDIDNYPETALYSFIPEVNNQQINYFNEELKKKINIKEILINLKINYQFNPFLLESILEMTKNSIKITSFFSLVIYFQLIDALYINNINFSPNDIVLIIKSLNKCLISDFNSPINYFLYEIFNIIFNNELFQWNINCIDLILFHFASNLTLNSNFYIFYIYFLKTIILYPNLDRIDQIFLLSIKLFEEKRQLIISNDYEELIKILYPFFNEFNSNSLHLLSLLSKFSFNNYINEVFSDLASLFISYIINNNSIILPKKINESNLLTNINFDFNNNFKFNSFNILKNHFLINNYLIILDECFNPFNLINQSIKDISSLLQTILNLSESKCNVSFFLKLIEIIESLKDSEYFYSIFAIFLYIYSNSAPIEMNSILLDLLSTNKIFNNNWLIFQPESLDLLINSFRNNIIESLISNSPNLLIKFINYFKNSPFIYIEILFRIKYFEGLIDWTIFSIDNFLETLLTNSLILIQINDNNLNNLIQLSQFCILDFLFILLKNPLLISFLFSNLIFCQYFFNFIFIKDFTDQFLNIFQYSLILLSNNSLINLKITLELIFKNQNNNLLILIKLFSSICEILRHNNNFIPLFENLFPLYLDIIQNFNEKINNNNIIIFLIFLSQFHNKFNLSFSIILKLSKLYHLKIINFNEIDFFKLFKASDIYFDSDIFLITEITYFDLLFSTIGLNNIILKKFKDLTDYSEFNSLSCHLGQLDYIILKYFSFKKENVKFYHNGYEINLNLNQNNLETLIFPLLKNILMTYSSNSILSIISKSILNNIDSFSFQMSEFIYNLLLKTSKNTLISYPINNFEPYYNDKSLKLDLFLNDFSIAFDIKIDIGVIISISTNINILKLNFSKNNLISIFINRGIIFFEYINGEFIFKSQITNRLLTNSWSKFIIYFKKEEKQRTIITYLNSISLPIIDCPLFDIIEKSNIQLILGGFNKINNNNDFLNIYCSSIFIYNYLIPINNLKIQDYIFNTENNLIGEPNNINSFLQICLNKNFIFKLLNIFTYSPINYSLNSLILNILSILFENFNNKIYLL